MDKTESDEKPDTSQLFLVRLWLDGPHGPERKGTGNDGEERGSEGRSYVHGKVQHVLSGKAAHFDDWLALVKGLDEMLSFWPAEADWKPNTR